MCAFQKAISKYVELGLDQVEAAVIVAEILAQARGKIRSASAERSARYRERKRDESVTKRDESVTVPSVTKRDESVTKRDIVTSAISFLDSKKVRKKERASNGAALREDWEPDEPDYVYGKALGLHRDEVDGLAEDMRLWAKANTHRAVGRKADWRSTFHGWMRREAAKIVRQRAKPDRSTYVDGRL